MALLQAAQILAARSAHLHIFEGLGDLPLFNPDHEANPPASVRTLWSAVSKADAIVIASPEYAHGVTGTIKNTLDWLVGHSPFAGKPVAVLNPSHRAEHADAALQEILRTMAADLVPGACLRIPVTASEWGSAQIATDEALSANILQMLSALTSRVYAT
jgi:NAD(P)H-dependent FMN reductase